MRLRGRRMPAKGQFKIDADTVAKTYFMCSENATQTGRALNVSAGSIIRTLKSIGIQTNKRNITETEKNEASRLYTEEKMSAPDIAARLGRHPSGLTRMIKRLGLSRTTHEAHALSAHKSKRKGAAGWWHSTKTGNWEVADSRYELVRMHQLDNDPTVVAWTRKTPMITYQGHKKYIPDFLIRYASGNTVLEEVKPKHMVAKELHATGKSKAAEAFCASNGWTYRVVTELEIGVLEIRNFVMDGLAAPEEQLRIDRKKQVDQDYRDRNRAMENSRTLAWYHKNRDRECAKRRERNVTKSILKAWSAAI